MNISRILKDAEFLPRVFEPLGLAFHVPRSLPNGGVLLGSDGGTDLVVEPTSGFVMSSDPEGAMPARFVNSSVAQFGRCIEAYHGYGMRVRDTPAEAEQIRLVQDLARQIREIDEACVAACEHWWSIILEQAEDGQL